MAKIQIKSEKLTPFGGIFSIMEQFDSTLSSVIDSTLSLRCNFISRLEYDTVYVASFNIISFAWSKLIGSYSKISPVSLIMRISNIYYFSFG